jgi:hypothetical protein
MNRLYCLLFLVVVGCGQGSVKPPSGGVLLNGEDFNAFFDNFSADSVFQKTRIDNPLPVIFSDSDGDSLQRMEVHKVSFDSKDWEGELEINQVRISEDTFKVILQVVDTGVFIEQYFALREGHWHLFEIIDSSD